MPDVQCETLAAWSPRDLFFGEKLSNHLEDEGESGDGCGRRSQEQVGIGDERQGDDER